jgi:hypothetical protein
VVELTSNNEEASATAPIVLIATFWAFAINIAVKKRLTERITFFIKFS